MTRTPVHYANEIDAARSAAIDKILAARYGRMVQADEPYVSPEPPSMPAQCRCKRCGGPREKGYSRFCGPVCRDQHKTERTMAAKRRYIAKRRAKNDEAKVPAL